MVVAVGGTGVEEGILIVLEGSRVAVWLGGSVGVSGVGLGVKVKVGGSAVGV